MIRIDTNFGTIDDILSYLEGDRFHTFGVCAYVLIDEVILEVGQQRSEVHSILSNLIGQAKVTTRDYYHTNNMFSKFGSNAGEVDTLTARDRIPWERLSGFLVEN